ncbi:MAG: S-layer homology domain-containing protein [Ruminococcus sp.]|jgi:hypothetical protein|nr:S-layer homology domain-containing protein [Ruminococcus sp.]
MKQKRILAAITAAMMFLSLGTTAFADTVQTAPSGGMGETATSGSDVDLQTALTTVKKRITVPDYLTEFNYSTGTNKNNTSYTFNWSQKNLGKDIVPLADSAGRTISRISVTVVGDIITRYNRDFNYKESTYDTSGAHLGALAVSLFETTAKKNIDILNPGMSKSIKFTGNYANLYGTSVTYRFTRNENGVDVTSNSGSIIFDKNTGDITNFNVTWWDAATFKSPDTKISEEAMEKAFTAAIDLDKEYIIKRDYKTKTVSSMILYHPEDNYEFDAFTGKKSTIWDDYAIAMQTTGMGDIQESGEGLESDDVMDAEEATAASNDVSFTEEELKAISENDKMVKRDEATAIILADPYIGLTKEYQLISGTLYTKNDFGVTNYWQLRYVINNTEKSAEIDVRLDADSGKVLSFDSYSYLKNQKAETAPKKLDIAKADKTAEAAFKYYMGSKNDEYKYNEADDPVYEEDPITKERYAISKFYSKSRYHEGIKVRNENAYMSIDGDGKISSFSYTYTDVDFPSSETLSQTEAYEKLWAQKSFKLSYNGFVGANGEAKTYLLYKLDSFYLNAKTGAVCNYNGDKVQSYESEKVTFSDVKGTKYETAVNSLLAYGVYLEPQNGKFAANAAITQGQFNRLLSNVYGSASLDEKSQDKTLTKADAAKIYVEATGGEEYAKLKGIYKAPYADVPEDHAYVGYIAIAKAEGVFESGGNFNPGSSLTRGDAIVMIYEMVK